MQYGYQCGMLWGAALAAGAQVYHQFGSGSKAETVAVIAARRLADTFNARNQDINCSEITEIEWKVSSQRDLLKKVIPFFLKGGPIRCFRMAAWYAPVVREVIESTLSENNCEVPSSPVSCASALAERLGVSPMHIVMTAGLAGGIGITPFKSMCQCCTDLRLNTKITLLYGNRRKEDIAFRKEFEELERQNKNLKVVFTLTETESDWKGSAGLITAEMIKKEVPDYKKNVFYTCGPPRMVEMMEKLVEQLGVTKTQLKREYFIGYT